MQGPLAITVIGGLLSSTGLTLGVIPVLYRLVELPRTGSGTNTSEAETT